MTRARLLVMLIIFMAGTTGCLGTAHTYKIKADAATQAGDHKAAAKYLALAAAKTIAEEQSGGRSIQEDAGVLNCLAGAEYAKANEWSKAKESINEGIAILQKKDTHYYSEQFKCKVLLANIAMRNGDLESARSLANEYIASAPTRTEVLPGDLLAEILDATDRPLAIEIRAQVLLSKTRMHRGDESTLKSWADALNMIATEYSQVGNAEASEKFMKRSNALKLLEIGTQDRKPRPTSAPRLARQYRALGFPERAEHFVHLNSYTRISAAKRLAKQDFGKSNPVDAIVRDLCLAGLYFAEGDNLTEAAAVLHKSTELIKKSESQEKRLAETDFICKTASAILQAKHSRWEQVKALGAEYLNYPTPLTLTNDYSVDIGMDETEPLAIKLDQLVREQNSNLSIQIRSHYLNSLVTESDEKAIQEHQDAALEYLHINKQVAEQFTRWAETIRQLERERFGGADSIATMQSKIARYRALDMPGRADALDQRLQSKRLAELQAKAEDKTRGLAFQKELVGTGRDTLVFCIAALYSIGEGHRQDATDFLVQGMKSLGGLIPNELRDITTFTCRVTLALAEAQEGNWISAEQLGEEYLTFRPPVADYHVEKVGFLADKLADSLVEHDANLSAHVRVHLYGFVTHKINALLRLYEDTARAFLGNGQNVQASRLLRMADFIRDVEGEGDFSTNPSVPLERKIQEYNALGFTGRAIALERMASAETEKIAKKDNEILHALREDLKKRRNMMGKQIEGQKAAAENERAKGLKEARSRAESNRTTCSRQCTDQQFACTVRCAGAKNFDQCNFPCLTGKLQCESSCISQFDHQVAKIEASSSSMIRHPQCDVSSLSREVDGLMGQLRMHTKGMSVRGAKCYAARNFVGIAELKLMVANACEAETGIPQAELNDMQEQERASCAGVEDTH